MCLLHCIGNVTLLDDIFASGGCFWNLFSTSPGFGLDALSSPACHLNSDNATCFRCMCDLVGCRLRLLVCSLSVSLQEDAIAAP